MSVQLSKKSRAWVLANTTPAVEISEDERAWVLANTTPAVPLTEESRAWVLANTTTEPPASVSRPPPRLVPLSERTAGQPTATGLGVSIPMGRDSVQALRGVSQAVRSVAQGVGESVSGALKGASLIGEDRPVDFSLLDRIDAGESPGQVGMPLAYVGTTLPGIRVDPRIREYGRANPTLRKTLRNRWRSERWAQERRIPTETLYRTGQAVDKWFKNSFPTDPKQRESFWLTKVPNALGQALTFLGGGAVARAPAAALGARLGARAAVVSPRAAPLRAARERARAAGEGAARVGNAASYGSAAGIGSLATRSGEFEQAARSGADLGTALQAGSQGGLIGLSEAVPIGNLLRRLDDSAREGVVAAIGRAMRQGTEEAIQEAGAQIMLNASAAGLYDPERGWLDDAGESGQVGFTTGAILQSLVDLVFPRQRSTQDQTPFTADDQVPFVPDDQRPITPADQRPSRPTADLRRPEPTPEQVDAQEKARKQAVNTVAEGIWGMVTRAEFDARNPENLLTEGDRASPIPDDVIAEGKAIVRDSRPGEGRVAFERGVSRAVQAARDEANEILVEELTPTADPIQPIPGTSFGYQDSDLSAGVPVVNPVPRIGDAAFWRLRNNEDVIGTVEDVFVRPDGVRGVQFRDSTNRVHYIPFSEIAPQDGMPARLVSLEVMPLIGSGGFVQRATPSMLEVPESERVALTDLPSNTEETQRGQQYRGVLARAVQRLRGEAPNPTSDTQVYHLGLLNEERQRVNRVIRRVVGDSDTPVIGDEVAWIDEDGVFQAGRIRDLDKDSASLMLTNVDGQVFDVSLDSVRAGRLAPLDQYNKLLGDNSPPSDPPPAPESSTAEQEPQLSPEEELKAKEVAREELKQARNTLFASARDAINNVTEKRMLKSANKALETLRVKMAKSARANEENKQKALNEMDLAFQEFLDSLNENSQNLSISDKAAADIKNLENAYSAYKRQGGFTRFHGENRDTGEGYVDRAAQNLIEGIGGPVLRSVISGRLGRFLYGKDAQEVFRQQAEYDEQQAEETSDEGLRAVRRQQAAEVLGRARLINEAGDFEYGVRLWNAIRNWAYKGYDPDPQSTFKGSEWFRNFWFTARAGLLNRYGLGDKYRALDHERAARMAGMQQELKDLLEPLMKDKNISDAELDAIQAYLTGDTAALQSSFARLGPRAEAIRQAIDALGQQAVDLGLLAPEVYARNMGAYLHRSYRPHETEREGRRRGARAQLRGDQFRGRGRFIKIDLNKVSTSVKDVLDQTPTGDLVSMTFKAMTFAERRRIKRVKSGSVIASAASAANANPQDPNIWEVRAKTNNEVVIWRDYTPQERQDMGEILNPIYNVAKTASLLSHDISTGQFYRDISMNQDWFQQEEPPEGQWQNAEDYGAWQKKSGLKSGILFYDPHTVWVRVPDTKIPDTKVPRYGALAGGYLKAEVWRDIKEMDAFRNVGALGDAMRAWKKSKTAWSWTTHTNNFMSNVWLAVFYGVRPGDMIAAMNSLARKDADYKKAVKAGVFGGDVVSQEFQNGIVKPYLLEIESENRGPKGGPLTWFNFIGDMLKLYANFTEQRYRDEDDLFRLALFIRNIRRVKRDELNRPTKEKLYSVEEAGRISKEWFLDYDIRAAGINALRRNVLPFVSYPYLALPQMLAGLARRPWRLAVVYYAQQAIQSLFNWVFSNDDDEYSEARLRQALYDPVLDQGGRTERGKIFFLMPRLMRVGTDKNGYPVMLDQRRWFPLSDVGDTGSIGLPGYPDLAVPGGPIVTLGEAIFNKSLFTGNEIYDPLTDTGAEPWGKALFYVARSFAPNVPVLGPLSWSGSRVIRAARGELDPRGNPYSMTEALLSSIGIKARPIDVDQRLYWRQNGFDQVERQLMLDIRTIRRRLGRQQLSEKQAVKLCGKSKRNDLNWGATESKGWRRRGRLKNAHS